MSSAKNSPSLAKISSGCSAIQDRSHCNRPIIIILSGLALINYLLSIGLTIMIGKSLLASQLRIKLQLSQGQARISHILSKIRERRTILDLFLKVGVRELQKIYSKTVNAFKNYKKRSSCNTLMRKMNICSIKIVRSKSQLPLSLLPKFPGS